MWEHLFSRTLLVLSFALAGCETYMQESYTDRQICYMARIYGDSQAYGYGPYDGEGGVSLYTTWVDVQTVVGKAVRARPYLADPNDKRNCDRAYPEVTKPLEEFYPKLRGVLQVPRFYDKQMGYAASAEPTLNAEALVFIGSALVGAASPPQTSKPIDPILTIDIAGQCPSPYLNRLKKSEDISGGYKICRY
jgi:hypothetical protein